MHWLVMVMEAKRVEIKLIQVRTILNIRNPAELLKANRVFKEKQQYGINSIVGLIMEMDVKEEKMYFILLRIF